MFEGAFSFRGRVGRLRYFLGQLMLMPIVFVAVFVVILMAAAANRSTASVVFFAALGLVIAIAVLWYSLSLQVRRIRDIGWSPLIVLGGFCFLLAADVIVAHHAPSLAISRSGTLFGTLLNLGLTAVLYLWPGNGGIDTHAFAKIAAAFDGPVSDDRVARAMTASGAASSGSYRQGPTVRRKTFGKRGLPRA